MTNNPELIEYPRGEAPALPVEFTLGETFHSVHFRLDTPSYRKPSGVGHDHEENAAFIKAMAGLLQIFGFTPRKVRHKFHSGEHETLYAHPDDLCGILTDFSRAGVRQALLDYTGLFTLQSTDIYERFEIIPAEEVALRVDYYRDTIKTIVFERMQTTRRDRFNTVGGWWTRFVTHLPGLRMLEHSEAENLLKGRVDEIISEMLSEGTLIKQAGSHIHYRSANKSELKGLSWRPLAA